MGHNLSKGCFEGVTVHIVSVNLSTKGTAFLNGDEHRTGILKSAVEGRVPLFELGLQGDVVVNTKHHGGFDQAVYLYTAEDYLWWSNELATPLAPGTFGENLTLAGYESADFCVGDRLKLPHAVLEVTAARMPCKTLAARMGDLGFVKRFRYAERPGVYCRVIEPGSVAAGDAVRLDPYQGSRIEIGELFRLYYVAQPKRVDIERLLEAPLADRTRQLYEQKLAQALA